MKSSRLLLALSLIVLGALLLIPQNANAGTIETVETILDVANTFKPDVPSGSQVDPLIRCLADKGQSIEGCAEFVGVGGVYLDTIVALYSAVTADNFGQIVDLTFTWLKDDAPCIIMDIMTGGAGGSLCELLKEVVEALVNIGAAVIEFFADIGGAVAEAVQDVGCAVGLGGCEESSPPDQIAYAWIFAPKIPEGVAAAESPDPLDYGKLLKGLKAQASAKPAQWNIDIPDVFKMEIPIWAVENAAKVYEQVVMQYRDADMIKSPGGILWALETRRGEYFNDQELIQTLGKQSVTQKDPSNWIWTHCTDDFKNGEYAAVDDWLHYPTSNPTIQSVKSKTLDHSKWCSNVFVYKHRPNEFAAIYRQYVSDNICPRQSVFVCPSVLKYDSCRAMMREITWEAQQECTMTTPTCDVFLDKYYCKDAVAYNYCVEWAKSAGVSTAAKCGLDTTELAPSAAYRVKQAMIDSGSKFAASCTVDGKKSSALMMSSVAETTSPQLVSKQDKSKSKSSAQLQKVGAANKVLARLPRTGPSVLDCPRPGLEFACKSKYYDYYGAQNLPEPLVQCTVTEDATYAAMRKQVTDVVNKLNEQGSGVFYQGQNDPLLVTPRNLGSFLDEQKKKKNYFKSPIPQKTFVFAQRQDEVVSTIDGLATPVMYFDGRGAVEGMIKDKGRTGVSVESRAKDSLQNMKTGGGNPIDQNTNPGMLQGPNVGINQGVKGPGMTTTGVNAPTQQVHSGTANAPGGTRPMLQPGIGKTLDNYERTAAAWRSAAPIQSAPRGCKNCPSIHDRIRSLDERSTELLKEGDALNQRLGSGRMKEGDARKATQKLDEITKQLDSNMALRDSLVSQYNTEAQRTNSRRISIGR